MIAVWIALSSVFVQYMGWWPKPDTGYFGYLKPVPAFASMAVPLMFLADWYLLFLKLLSNYANFI